jgi:aminoglycoside phosphotransferase (APT) family kinase protein
MPTIVFPMHADELTPELLTAALSERQPGVVVERLRVVEEAHCDTGSASTAGRAVLDLDYAAERDEGLPRRVVLKTVLIRPGAPSTMYQNEVRFYRDLRPELDIETPQAYASIFDEASGTFGVVMEDVRLKSARFPNATQSMSHEEITYLLSQLASLHAHFWQCPRFSRDLRWLWTPCSGGFHDFLQSEGRDFIQQLLAASEYKRELLSRLGRTFEEVWVYLWKAQAILASEPGTLLHGDTHFGNTYLLPGDRVGLLDWQLMNRGRWSHDVTYILMTALDTEYRREHQRELLAYYLDRLHAGGVEPVPDREAAWLLYRQTAIWGFLIGWMICPTENYGEEIMRANLERLMAALEDLDTFEALET